MSEHEFVADILALVDQWVPNQDAIVAAGSAMHGYIETRKGTDVAPVVNRWLVDNAVTDNIVSASIVSEFDYSRGTMPLETCSVTIENGVTAGEPNVDYDFVTPANVTKLDAPGSIDLELGYRYDDNSVERMPMTRQILTNVAVTEDDMYATFDGISFPSVLDDETYYGGHYDPAGIAASTLFEEILSSARFPTRGQWAYLLGDSACLASDSMALWSSDGYTYYTIDTAFDSVMVYLPIPPVTYREALVMLAAYVGAYLIHRADGSLSVISTLVDKPTYTLFETVYDRPKMVLGQRINRLKSALSSLTVGASAETIYDGDILLADLTQVTRRLDHDACDEGSLVVTVGGALYGTPIYGTYSTEFTVDPTDTTIHVTLTGKRITMVSRPLEKTYYPSGDVVELSCPIASDSTLTEAMLDHYNAVVSATRFEFSMRDDPILKIGDCVSLQVISDRQYSVWNYHLGEAACVVSATVAIQTTRWDNIIPVVMNSIKRRFDGASDADCVAIVNINP